MNYKYPPIYKYGLLFLVIYMFMKHQKILPQDKLLLNAIMIILIFFIFDNIIINNHPSLLEDVISNTKKKNDDFDDISDDELDDIINSFDMNIESELSNDDRQINVRNTRKSPPQQQRQYYDTTMVY